MKVRLRLQVANTKRGWLSYRDTAVINNEYVNVEYTTLILCLFLMEQKGINKNE